MVFFRHEEKGCEFKLLTHHLSLKWLNSNERLVKWALELQYKSSVSYRRREQNVVPDAFLERIVSRYAR